MASLKSKVEGCPYQVIVVDNSADKKEFETVSKLAKEYGGFAIDAKENLGFGRANNLGASKASGEYLFFLNTDTYLLNDAVSLLASYLDANPKVGVAGPNIFDANKSPAHSYRKKALTAKGFKRENSFGGMIGRALKRKREDFNYSNQPLRLDGYVCGAAMMIRRDAFEKLGGFDSRIFMYAEESLLCHRTIHELGLEIHNLPSAKIVHLEGKSFSAEKAPWKAKVWTEGNSVYYATVFGQQEKDKFLSSCVKIFGKKAFFAKILKKKERELYYRAFKKAAIAALKELSEESNKAN